MPNDQHVNPKSDIEIAQAAVMHPISEIATEKLGVSADHLEPYGHYKAKISLDYIKTLADKPDGKLLEPPEGFRPWHAFYSGQDAVIYGHWARQGLTVRERLRGLDTGCVYGGQLTGLWWPADRLVQVESRQPYRRLPIVEA